MNFSRLVKYDPVRSFSYLPLPNELKGKKACLNIQKNGENNFLLSILALFHPVQCRNDQHRVSKYQEYEHQLNISGIQNQVDINIGKFEHQNNISVNICGYEDKKIFPLRTATMTTARHHLNLLYITADKTSHYPLVKDLSRLASSLCNNNYRKKYFHQFQSVCMPVSVKMY